MTRAKAEAFSGAPYPNIHAEMLAWVRDHQAKIELLAAHLATLTPPAELLYDDVAHPIA